MKISDAEFQEFLQWFNRIVDEASVWNAQFNQPSLSIPYRSQWDSDGMKFRNDCGPAVLAMVLGWKGINQTIDQLAVQCSMSSKQPFTLPGNLISAAKIYGVLMSRKLNVTLNDLRSQFIQQKPVILLVHYGSLTQYVQDKSFKAGHWLLGHSIDTEHIVVHDPDWKAPLREQGVNLSIPIGSFIESWGNCHLDGNMDNQAVFIE